MLWYLRHPRHGEKVANSHLEYVADLEHGWEEFDPSEENDSESPAPSEMAASGDSAHNALRTRRRRKE